jgi:hypothetical protein
LGVAGEGKKSELAQILTAKRQNHFYSCQRFVYPTLRIDNNFARWPAKQNVQSIQYIAAYDSFVTCKVRL